MTAFRIGEAAELLGVSPDTVRRWVELSLPPSITWTLVERSPFNPPSAR